jgi:hypothetical protein
MFIGFGLKTHEPFPAQALWKSMDVFVEESHFANGSGDGDF